MTERITNMADGNTSPENGTPSEGDVSQPNLGRKVGNLLNRFADKLERFAETQPINQQTAVPTEQQPGPVPQAYNPNRSPERNPNIAIALGPSSIDAPIAAGGGGDGRPPEGPPRGPENSGPPESNEDNEREINEENRIFRHFHTRRVARIDAMRSEERDTHLAEYEASVNWLHHLAASDKFGDEGRAILEVRLGFDRFQEAAIQRVSTEVSEIEGDRLRRRLLALENLENQLSGINLAMDPWRDSRWESARAQDVKDLPSGDDLYALFGGKQAYETMKVKKEALEEQRNQLYQAIAGITGPQFLQERDTQQESVKSMVRGLEDKMRREENLYSENLEDVGLPDWVYEAERDLYIDNAPRLVSEIESIDQINISFDALDRQIVQQGLTSVVTIKDKAGNDLEVEAGELLEWYFYEARQLGMFDALDVNYRDLYEDIRNRILNTNQPVAPTRRGGGESSQAAAPESSLAADVLKRFSDEELLKDINLYESDRAWKTTRRKLVEKLDAEGNSFYQDSHLYKGRAIPSSDARSLVGRFKGIKGAFITRTYEQLYTVTDALLETRGAMYELRQRGLSPDEFYRLKQKEEGFEKRLEEIRTGALIDEARLAGEFDIVAIERAIQIKEEDRGKSREQPYNFYWSTYELKGRSRGEVEVSVNAATRDLLENITAYDANEMLGRMKAIVDAVGRMREAANLEEDDIKYLQRITTNRVLFALAPFFGALVQMENYATILARWADGDGYDRLAEVPTMLGGYTAKALDLRNTAEYRLRYRLDGFAGHLSDNQGSGGQLTQRFIRGNLEEMMVDDLMEYEIAGDTPAARNANRDKLKKNITKAELDSLFVVRSVEYQRLNQKFVQESQGKLTLEELSQLSAVVDPEEYQRLSRALVRKSGNTVTLGGLTRLRELRNPKDVMSHTGRVYSLELARADQLIQSGHSLTLDDIRRLRNLRKEHNSARQRYVVLRKEAKDAMAFSGQVMDTFGESARIGAPSIRISGREVVVNGDTKEIKELISIEDTTLILEWAVMQEAKKIGDYIRSTYGIDLDDNGGLIRWRMRYYLAGGDSAAKNANMEVKVKKIDGSVLTMKASQFFALFNTDTVVNLNQGHSSAAQGVGSHDHKKGEVDPNHVLRKGFEDTGFTKSEFNALLDAFKNLKTNGTRAIINNKTIDQILNEMQDLKPVLNYYLAVDIYGSDIFTDPLLRKRVAEGKEPFVENLISRLNWFGLQSVYERLPEHNTTSKRKDLGYVIESSRGFHETVKGLVYYLGTRKDFNQVYNETKYIPIITNPYIPKAEYGIHGIYDDKTDFDPSGMYLGFPNIQLGIKRIMYLNNFWLDFNDVKVARGVANLPFFRMQVNSLSERLGAKDINEVIWNMNKEYFDLPDLQMFAETMKNAVLFRAAGETSISDKGEMVWGFWDKLLSDAENLWSVVHSEADLYSKVAEGKEMSTQDREKAVGAVEEVLKRYKPMINLMEKSLEHDRNAVGSGAGEETFQRNALKFLGWMLSAGGSQRKEQGGRGAHKDVEALLFFILQKGIYREDLEQSKIARDARKLIKRDEDRSIWDRVWDKIKPQANPGLSMYPPIPYNITA